MRMTLRANRAFVFLGIFLVQTAPLFAATDPFSGLTSMVVSNARSWASALLILGGLVCGGHIILGGHQSGEKMRNFLFGAIFLVAAGLGTAMYDWLSGFIGVH